MTCSNVGTLHYVNFLFLLGLCGFDGSFTSGSTTLLTELLLGPLLLPSASPEESPLIPAVSAIIRSSVGEPWFDGGGVVSGEDPAAWGVVCGGVVAYMQG